MRPSSRSSVGKRRPSGWPWCLTPNGRCGLCSKPISAGNTQTGTPNRWRGKLHEGAIVNQAELLERVIDILESQRLAYMLVGSFASAAYGEARLTHDIDIVVEVGLETVDRLCSAFPAPEFYVSLPAAREAVVRRGQFNVIHPGSGNKIDFMIARNDAWGQSQMARRGRKPILPDRQAFVAAPEDVIVGKLWYYHEGGSEKHLRDVAGNVAGQRRGNRHGIRRPLDAGNRPRGGMAGRARSAGPA